MAGSDGRRSAKPKRGGRRPRSRPGVDARQDPRLRPPQSGTMGLTEEDVRDIELAASLLSPSQLSQCLIWVAKRLALSLKEGKRVATR